MSKHLTAPIPTKSLPGGIPFIIGNEAAERFSFYGMKGILVIFMTTYLWVMSNDPNAQAMDDAQARYWYHMFTSAVYITPFIGALIADVFLGKYLTIMLLSIVYCVGHGMLALMGGSLPGVEGALNPGFFLFLGLALIALGGGGIKPCVSAHVGDQFGKSNAQWLNKVFGWFYVSINVGAFISNLLTPYLLYWYGPHWAFGVPGVLMAIATLVFWLGRNRFIHVPPGGFAFLKQTFSRDGILAMLKLAVIYIFVAVFWALFDQTGSSMVLQAENLNRMWLGIEWLESQIQAINPFLILVLVPLFSFVLYPTFDRLFFKLTPLHKISIGLFLMVPAFAIVSMVQGWVDAGHEPTFGWQILAYVLLTASEVMVSITCLEFSYTQAPRKMKSFIMALFLASVTLGNLFTAGVNHFIQIPALSERSGAIASLVDASSKDDGASKESLEAQLAELYPGTTLVRMENGGYEVLVPWDGFIGDDRIKLGINEAGVLSKTTYPCADELRSGAKLILEAWVRAEEMLPGQEIGQKILSNTKDCWGNSLNYRVVNKNEAVISSFGPKGADSLSDDIHLTVTITSTSDVLDPNSWLGRELLLRKERFGSSAENGEVVAEQTIDGKTFNESLTVGGGNTLEGADYFWFFTYLMLATSILFIPVALIYRPKEYLQEEGDHAEALEEGISA
jgi:POT family proton-dependent oligopeptide transporter